MRHACMVTSTVSSVQAPVKAPSSNRRARFRRDEETTSPQTIVINVRPNDNPKVAGLRNDNGPCQDPPPVTRIARWINPLASNSAPTT